ncbi:MAG: DUF3297 family protein [Zymomonas mobilis]|uniref:Uncharacterized protein DUF3297 n=1 Tax=Zymomonas mobilis TaxID=542 RepID=A0A542W399_ZYMMB|nr:DUF3297 family protein [Zymomonas mobilis]TQL18037.1 uncharacterized protein DUF3297 [Zymomonas mobilis]
MTDTPPDHLSVFPDSDFFDADALRRGVGIRFKGQERTDVEEYCISESWVKVAAGRSRDRFGRPMTVKLTGPVESFYQDMEQKDDAAEDSQAS